VNLKIIQEYIWTWDDLELEIAATRKDDLTSQLLQSLSHSNVDIASESGSMYDWRPWWTLDSDFVWSSRRSRLALIPSVERYRWSCWPVAMYSGRPTITTYCECFRPMSVCMCVCVCVRQSDETALHISAMNGFTDCASQLLTFARIDVDSKNEVSWCLMHMHELMTHAYAWVGSWRHFSVVVL